MRIKLVYLYIILSLLGIILLLISILIKPDTSIWKSVLIDLGSGALVATFLGLTIERVANENFQNEANLLLKRVKENVFLETLNSMLPKAVVEEVQFSIFSQTLLRKNLEIVLTLEEDDGLGADKLKQSMGVSYELINFGSTIISTNITNSVSLFPKPNADWIVYNKVCIEQKGERPIELSGDKLQALTSVGEIDASFNIPVILYPHKPINVSFSRDIISYRRDRHTMVMPIITENFKIIVTAPHDLAVEADIRHPAAFSDLETQKERVHKAYGQNTYVWEVRGCLLLYQGVELRWTTKQVT